MRVSVKWGGNNHRDEDIRIIQEVSWRPKEGLKTIRVSGVVNRLDYQRIGEVWGSVVEPVRSTFHKF